MNNSLLGWRVMVSGCGVAALMAMGWLALSGGSDVAAQPHGAPPEANGTIRGTISLEHLFLTAVRSQDVLYIMAHDATATPDAPPVAVKKIDRPIFPLSYVLSQHDVMAGGVFEGRMIISVRVDKDGVAGGQIGDLEGRYAGNPVLVGATEVDIVIDRVR